MLCIQCHKEIKETAIECPNCGTLVPRSIPGFENMNEVKQSLRSLVTSYGNDIIKNNKKFVSFLNDYIPEYEKERRLIKNVISNDVIKNMIKEENHNIAIMKAKEFMSNELFLSENACEFVMECFTYILGWNYVSEVAIRGDQSNSKEIQSTHQETDTSSSGTKVFKAFDAMKYKLRGTIEISQGYTAVDSFCFDGFNFLKAVKLPDTLVSIGEYAFSECKRLKTVDLPSSLRAIKKSAFSLCVKLNKVNIPNGVIAIEEGTFSFCHNLEIVEIPSSVSSIGPSAFSGCEKLKKLFVPDSVKFIGEDAFSLCNSLVISCYENSYVHKYCIKNGISFDVIQKSGIPKAL